MSRTLPNGLWSKTGIFPFAESEESGYTHYAEIGDTRVKMEEAVEDLRQAFDDPIFFADPRFEQFRRYIKSYYPVEWVEEGQSFTTLEPAMPHFPLDVEDLEQDPGPSRVVLGHELSLYDIMSFTHYLLTNTTVDGEHDPRLAWLEEIRGNQEPTS